MKNWLLFIVILFILSVNNLYSIDVSGTINTNTTWTAVNSPYNLTGDITIYGAELTVESGVVVNLGANQIFVNASSSGSASLNADGVNFTSSYSNLSAYIDFDGYNPTYTSGGTLTNCTFENLYFYFDDNSSPTVSNSTVTYSGTSPYGVFRCDDGSTPTILGDTVSGFNYAVSILDGSTPSLSSNDFTGCTEQYIGLGGSFSTDYVLENYGYPITLISDLTILQSTFTFPSGTTIDMVSNQIFVNASSSDNASLNADEVNFTSSYSRLYAYIDFDGYNTTYTSGGTLTNCTFENLYIHFDDNSNPTVSNSTATYSGTSNYGFLRCEDGSTPTISGNTVSGFSYGINITNESVPTINSNDFSGCTNQYIGLGGSFKEDYSLQDYGYPVTLTSDLTISQSTFTFPSGATIDMVSNQIFVNASNSGGASLNANDVNFTSSYSRLYAYIDFDGYNSTHSSGGALTNCTFENLYFHFDDNSSPTVSNSTATYSGTSTYGFFRCEDGSTPTISGNTVTGFSYGINITNESIPTISSNDFSGCTNQYIGLGGSFKDDYSLQDYGYPVTLTSDLTISQSTFTFPSGTTIDMVSNQIFVNASSLGSASLNASGVNFTSSYSRLYAYIDFDGYNSTLSSGGALTNCTFENLYFHFDDNSNPTISNSLVSRSANAFRISDNALPVIVNNDIFNNDIAVLHTGTSVVDLTNNYWGHYNGPFHDLNPGGKGEEVSGGNVSLIPFATTPYNGNVTPELVESTLSFDEQFVGDNQDIYLHIINKGNIDLKLTDYVSESNSFIIQEIFPIWAPHNDTTSITVRFAPTQEGNFNELLKFATGDLNNDTLAISVSGIGLSVIQLSLDSMNFGDVYIKTTDTLDFWIKNVGDEQMTIDSIIFPYSNYRYEEIRSIYLKSAATYKPKHNDVNNPSQEQLSKLSGLSTKSGYNKKINPGDSLHLQVMFRPNMVGNYDGDLMIYYNTSGIEILPIIGSGYADPLSVDILSLNYQNFPFIYMNVAVDTFGTGINSLDITNFSVSENDNIQSDYFEVIPPSKGNGSRLADIIFVLDVSGSMQDEINAVKSNMESFITSLDENDVNYGIGFVTFADKYYTYNNSNLYYDKESIISIIDNIKLGEYGLGDGGDYEENQLGSMAISSLFNFRPGSQKIQIMITDATSHESDGITEWSVSSLISERLYPNNISVYPVFNTSEIDQINQYLPIAEETANGSYFYVYENFNAIIDYISNSISNTYVLKYRSSKPEFDGLKRNVRVNATYQSSSAYDTISYIPGSLPLINRTQATMDLENQAWAENTSLSIEAIVKDKVIPFIQEVTLFYRNSSDIAYSSLAMSQYNDTIWIADIPTEAVLSPGVDYYITANDGQGTSSLPKVTPAQKPFQVAILPNYAPVIEHEIVAVFEEGDLLTFSAEITDNTNILDSVAFFYRNVGQLSYTVNEMTNLGGDIYQFQLLTTDKDSIGIEYYIVAWDDFGVKSSVGNADSPNLIWTSLLNSIIPVNSIQRDYKVSLYPNPALNKITASSNIVLEAGSLVQIYDISGRIMQCEDLKDNCNSYELDISSLESGIYIIKLTIENGILVKEFVKE